MNSRFTIEDIHHKIIEEDILKWKMHSEKNKKIFFAYIVIGVINIALGLSDYETSSLNIQFSIGIAFILLSLIYIVQNKLAKNKYYKNTQVRANRYKNNSTEASIEITDVSLIYKDYALTQERKWCSFTAYTLYHEYLFLIMDDNYLSSIIIDKRHLRDDEFSELLSFVKKTLDK